MKENILILTVGLPRIGKTTWAKELSRVNSVPIVNPDAIRLAIHGQPFVSDAEPYVWAVAKTMVRSLFLAGHDTVIVDATNTTKSRRQFWESRHWTRDYQVFGGPQDRDLCIARAKETCVDKEHEDGLIAAINRMADAWEPIEQYEIETPL